VAALFEDVDLSNTVGWFTSLYPLLLAVRGPAGPGDVLKAIKEQLRRVPRGGLSFGVGRFLSGDAALRSSLASLPRAAVGFNYLGQFDQLTSEGSLFTPATESVGPMLGPANARSHLLDVAAVVSGGRLHVQWVYGRHVHAREASLMRVPRGALRARCKSGRRATP